MLLTFGERVLTVDDLFYYGVFCHEGVYSYFNWNDDKYDIDFEVPDVLLTDDADQRNNKIELIRNVILDVLTGEIEKPQWMVFIEQEEFCNRCNDAPSTFLRVIAKSPEYIDLAEKLTDFLYSPNAIITWAK